MANDEDLAQVRQGTAVWNAWRAQNPERHVDLCGAGLVEADLRETNLSRADLRGANLSRADLRGANLYEASLRGANLDGTNLGEANLIGADLGGSLIGANLIGANLRRVNLIGVNLRGADLRGVKLIGADLSGADLRAANFAGANLRSVGLLQANLRGANLSRTNMFLANLGEASLAEADLRRANLQYANLSRANLDNANLQFANLHAAILIQTNLTRADLTGCVIYGISAWDLILEGAVQRDLVITRLDQPEITVDNLDVAQFVYLLLHNEKIRDVIDTIGKKGVLLLGRFSGGRMALLDRLREELRKRDFIPIVFNFERPEKSDFTETVRTLVGLCRFIIADITSPRSTPLELQATVPDYMIPFVPIIEDGEEPFAMFQNLWVKHRAWVLDPIAYGSVEELVQGLDKEIIEPALARFDELVKMKAEKLPVRRMGAAPRDD